MRLWQSLCVRAFEIALVAILWSTQTHPGHGQVTRCADCRLEVTPAGNLSSEATLAVPSLTASVAQLRTGFAVSYGVRTPHIAVFDLSGNLLHSYDRTGRGPGELRYSPSLITRGPDTLIAVDITRFTWMDANLRPTATRNLAPWGRTSLVLALPAGTIAITYDHRGPDGRRYLVAVVNREGEAIAHLEPAIAASDSTYPHLAEAHDGGFFVVRTNESMVKHYTASGQHTRTIQLRGSEFRTYPPSERWVDGRRQPFRSGIMQMGPHHLLVTTYLPAATFRRPEGMFNLNEFDASVAYDTLLEVVDLDSGHVLAVSRHPDAIRLVRGSGEYGYFTRETDDGHVIIELLRIRFHRSSSDQNLTP